MDERDGLLLGRGEEAAVSGDELAELLDPPLLDDGCQQVQHRLVVDIDGGGVEGQVQLRQVGSSSHLALWW